MTLQIPVHGKAFGKIFCLVYKIVSKDFNRNICYLEFVVL